MDFEEVEVEASEDFAAYLRLLVLELDSLLSFLPSGGGGGGEGVCGSSFSLLPPL